MTTKGWQMWKIYSYSSYLYHTRVFRVNAETSFCLQCDLNVFSDPFVLLKLETYAGIVISGKRKSFLKSLRNFPKIYQGNTLTTAGKTSSTSRTSEQISFTKNNGEKGLITTLNVNEDTAKEDLIQGTHFRFQLLVITKIPSLLGNHRTFCSSQ